MTFDMYHQIEMHARMLYADDVRSEGWDWTPWHDLDPADRQRYRRRASELMAESMGQDRLERERIKLQMEKPE